MKKSFLKKTIIALPLFASSAWAGGERIDSPEDLSTLHLVLRLRTPDVGSNARFVNPETGSQTLVLQPNENASNSDDSLQVGKSKQSQNLSKTPPLSNSEGELNKDKLTPDSDTSLPTPLEVHDEESKIRTDMDTLQPVQIMRPDSLSTEKEQLRLQIAALKKQNQAFQEELELQKNIPNTTATDETPAEKKKAKKGLLKEVNRFGKHLKKRKF